MRNLGLLVASFVVAAGGSAARAQESVPLVPGAALVGDASPLGEPSTPALETRTPLWEAPSALCVPSQSEVDALAEQGYRKKKLGALLMVSGAILAAVGIGLSIAASNNDADRHCVDYGPGPTYGYDRRHYSCASSALSVAGTTTTLIAIGTLLPGMAVYVSGGADVDDAQRFLR